VPNRLDNSHDQIAGPRCCSNKNPNPFVSSAVETPRDIPPSLDFARDEREWCGQRKICRTSGRPHFIDKPKRFTDVSPQRPLTFVTFARPANAISPPRIARFPFPPRIPIWGA